jgi:hypothetical protein
LTAFPLPERTAPERFASPLIFQKCSAIAWESKRTLDNASHNGSKMELGVQILDQLQVGPLMAPAPRFISSVLDFKETSNNTTLCERALPYISGLYSLNLGQPRSLRVLPSESYQKFCGVLGRRRLPVVFVCPL